MAPPQKVLWLGTDQILPLVTVSTVSVESNYLVNFDGKPDAYFDVLGASKKLKSALVVRGSRVKIKARSKSKPRSQRNNVLVDGDAGVQARDQIAGSSLDGARTALEVLEIRSKIEIMTTEGMSVIPAGRLNVYATVQFSSFW